MSILHIFIKSHKKWFVVIPLSIFISCVGIALLAIGISLVEKAQHENISEIKALEIPKIITYHDEYDSTGKEEFGTVYIDWSTNDTFSVDNNLRGDITVYLQKNVNITEISAMQLGKGSDLSWENNGTLIPIQLDKVKKSNHYMDKYSVVNNSYRIPFVTKVSTESPLIVVVILKFQNDQQHITSWVFSSPFDFPTIYPYTAKLQAETDRAVQRQVLESEITNDTIGGLTWIIVGLVPLGLVAEFWIEYAIENHFYRKEYSDPNYYHSG